MSSMDQTIMTPAERVRRLVVPVLAALLTLAALVQVANVPSMLGYLFYTEQFLAVVLALGLPVVFLGKSRDGNRTIPRILLIASDWIFAALSFGAALYLALRYPELGSAWLAKPVDAMVVAALLLPLVLEAVRLGWTAYIVPFIFVFSPALLLNGDPVEVVIAVVTASLGVYAVSAAFVGWMAGRLSIGIRLLLGCAGAALLIPAAPGDNMTVALNASGFLLLSGLFLTFRARSRHSVNIPANVTSHEE
jgi:TRAP-type uncharacterized transport system fused permease subunit